MKRFAPAMLAFLVPACASPTVVEGLKTDPDAMTLMLSSLATDRVQGCFAQAFGPGATAGEYSAVNADGQVVPTYRVRAIDDPRRRYRTEIDVIGYSQPASDAKAVRCLQPD